VEKGQYGSPPQAIGSPFLLLVKACQRLEEEKKASALSLIE
jgi:hypothetical protein